MQDIAEQRRWAAANPLRRGGAAREVLVVCSTFRDHRELPRLARPALTYLFHDYASTSLEELIDGRAEGLDGVADPISEIARISGPLGLDIGALTPAETALSIMAEVLATRRGRSGGRLAEAAGRIHPEPVAS